ncbi:hypothetical protein CTI12_AA376160 [Artemisia annua]|uniref:Tf2-1-like SH3-like domain-containing protein n=1 Tax=Artemisia annua TaxID=35608 RepID=A0A2U1MIH9_ARTAN|nr:hypothetical protein CTI12_AA376160 [Artemisia annua]
MGEGIRQDAVDQLEQSHQKDGGDKTLSEVLNGINTIITILHDFTTRGEREETELKELRQTRQGWEEDEEDEGLGLAQEPRNQPSFQHQDIHEELKDEPMNQDHEPNISFENLRSSVKESQVATQDEQPSRDYIQLPKLRSRVIKEDIMIEHEEVQGRVKQKLDLNLEEHKDKHHVEKRFHVGDLVKLGLRNKFLVGAYNKLKMKRIGPCKVVGKLNDSSYVFYLSKHLSIYPIFYVVDVLELQQDTLFSPNRNSRTSFFQEGENDAVCVGVG